MTVSPVLKTPGSEAFAVTPVVDYEPARRDVPACRQSSRSTLRRRARVPRRPYPGQPGKHPQATGIPPVTSPPMRQAAIFADAALRRVLEVIDRRRPAAQLRPVLAPSLVDSVVAIGRSAIGRQGAAVLRRLRVQPAGRHDAETAAEVSGSFSRGDRIHAIACRVEQVRGVGGATDRWQVVALHIG
ncbi:Rv3235 family protein [Mycobacterium sp. 852002-51057_SCH5723018]|uniref:Rv3235 family protein n=1 Tax=Mycobacterium sp. 852002-51057_SCH5723018 TaxID=1834094 RepID=UPI00080237EC|nr:Rv3235 family protein [Mycobacterium sp. 852002-51057_SCH5723018]OBG29525.1 hypothetical protein A5764_21195 [Mycobacterium sp. 852002-51057_SCH5723018]